MRGLEKRHEPLGRLLREPVPDPLRIGPGQAVENHPRVALAGLGHEPELVAAGLGVRQLLASDRVGGFAAASGILATADLDLQMLEAGAEARLEEIIEDLAALRFRVVGKQPRGRARTDGPDTLEHAAGRRRIKRDDFRGVGCAPTQGRGDQRDGTKARQQQRLHGSCSLAQSWRSQSMIEVQRRHTVASPFFWSGRAIALSTQPPVRPGIASAVR